MFSCEDRLLWNQVYFLYIYNEHLCDLHYNIIHKILRERKKNSFRIDLFIREERTGLKSKFTQLKTRVDVSMSLH